MIPYWLKQVMESFTIFTLAIIDNIILYYFIPQQDFAKWLGDLQFHLRYRNSIWNKETEIKYCSFSKNNVFTLPVSFTGSYTEDEPNFPHQNNLILQKKVFGIDKVVNFKDFSRPNKKSSTFQGPKPNSRTFQDE